MAQDLARDYPFHHWLLTEARQIRESKAFVTALAERFLDHGIEVSRLVIGVPILHPHVFATSTRWDAGVGASERTFRLTAETLPVLENSPVKTVYSGGGSVRCDPTQPPREGEFNILADLRREGVTDYIALSVPFSDGTTKLLAVATRRPGGFRDEEIQLFESLTPALGAVLETHALRLTARTLLDTYVGRQAGARVLSGVIKRGMGETIRSVIWLADLRGFTGFSETLPGAELIQLLNDYFGRMCQGLDAEGGEVLKFIGDALLAIFPVRDEDPEKACARALTAASSVQASLAALNDERIAAGNPRIDYGIALHLGDVIYGNIGGENRLDFTVIGPAVNLAARIGSLCRDLDRPLLLSADFVAASGVEAEPLGTFPLKGLKEAQTVYAPAAGRS
jgi:adenylate cyclase